MGAPELALLNRRVPHAIEVIRTQPDWVLLYQDALAELWGRRGKYDDPQSPDYLPPEVRRIGNRPQSGFVQFPALPGRDPSL
jgi:hypothetical protein